MSSDDERDDRQRNVKRLRLVDDIAADDDEEGEDLDYINDNEEDDGDDDGSDLKDFIANDDDANEEVDPELAALQGDDPETVRKRAKLKLQKRKERKAMEDRQHMSYDQIRDMEEDQRIEDELKRKYGDVDNEDEVDMYGDEGADYGIDTSTSNSMIPTISDPKLWLIKCDPGKEEESVLALMKRYLLKQNTVDERFFIYSAFTTPASHGYVYVESDKEVHVKKAIQGIRALKAWRCTLVPVNQMVSALTFNSTQKVIENGQWVRIKGGQYKQDLGRVVAVADHNTRITVKLTPRIDLIALEDAARNGTADKNKRKRGAVRPSQKLFDVNEIQQLGGLVSRKRGAVSDKIQNYYLFMSNRYKGGYLYKDFNISGLIIDDVTPRPDEIERFKERKIDDGDDADDDIDDAVSSQVDSKLQLSSNSKTNLAIGDRIVVTSGDTKHITGRVVNILKDRLTIQPDANQPISMQLDLQFNQIKKYFQIGDHVKVIAGPSKNETGLITQVRDADSTVTLFSDTSMAELTVNSQDLMETSEVSTGNDSLGQYELGDLVQLTGDDVGVIVKSDASSFKVLTHRGVLQTAQLHDIVQSKHSRFATALDANSNQIAKDDIVNVVQGQYSGKQGTIKHLYRGAVWLFNRSVTDNGGYFVAPGKHVAHVNSALLKQQQQQQQAYGMPPPMPSFGRGRGGMSGGRGRGGFGGMKGQTITIKNGPYKGYVGRVVDETPMNVRVELSAITRTVQVRRDQVVEKQATAPPMLNNERYGLGSATPLLGSKTPAYDYYGSKTPAYESGMGGMTPAHTFGGATPAHGGAQTPSSRDVWSAQTPAHTLNSNAASTDEFDLEQQMMSLSQNYNASQYTQQAASATANSTSNAPAEDDNTIVWPVQGRVSYHDRQGTIQLVNKDHTCTVKFDDTNSTQSVPQGELQQILPDKNDQVAIIQGSLRRQRGEMVGVNADEAIVEVEGDIHILNVKLLCKIAA